MYLFLLPLKEIRKIMQEGTTSAEHTDTQYVVSSLNCTLWILYLSRIANRRRPPLASNIAGLTLELCYIVAIGCYHPSTRRKKLFLQCGVASAIVAMVFFLATQSEHDAQVEFFGKACMVIN